MSENGIEFHSAAQEEKFYLPENAENEMNITMGVKQRIFPKMSDFVLHVISMAKCLLQTGKLAADLAFLNSYLDSLTNVKKKMEGRRLSLNALLELVVNVRLRIIQFPGSQGSILRQRTENIFT